MRKIVITKAGLPEVLQVQESPDLEPAENEIRIAVKAAGLNFADILARQGLYPDAPKTPCTVGYEVSGIVDKVGTNIDEEWLGKEVFALTRFGGQAEQVLVPLHQVFEKPTSLSFEQAAAIPVNYLTAYQLLVAMGSLHAHETVLIHNAGGGVGLAALEIAKHIGATTFGTASSGKHSFLKEKGLDHAIDYRTQDWKKELLALTDGRGVDLITDPIGGKSLKQSYKALSNTGRLGMFGISSVSNSGIKGKLKMIKMIGQTPFYHPFSLMDQNKGVFGVNMGHLWHEYLKIDIWMQALLKGVEEEWISPRVDKAFTFAEAAEAHRYIEGRKNIGKVVLVP
jgi:NADPH:quinone reductase-like Zn-dependent oxidoreductase